MRAALQCLWWGRLRSPLAIRGGARRGIAPAVTRDGIRDCICDCLWDCLETSTPGGRSANFCFSVAPVASAALGVRGVSTALAGSTDLAAAWACFDSLPPRDRLLNWP